MTGDSKYYPKGISYNMWINDLSGGGLHSPSAFFSSQYGGSVMMLIMYLAIMESWLECVLSVLLGTRVQKLKCRS